MTSSIQLTKDEWAALEGIFAGQSGQENTVVVSTSKRLIELGLVEVRHGGKFQTQSGAAALATHKGPRRD
ncbi:hypothetical protein D3C87_1926290 [compost metagenome]